MANRTSVILLLSWLQGSSLLALSHEDEIALGKSFVTKPWVAAPAATKARDGLGPLANANSCISCHRNFGDGGQMQKTGPLLTSMIAKLTNPNQEDPHYGQQLSPLGTLSVPFEGIVHVQYRGLPAKYADGQTTLLRVPDYSVKSLNYGPLSAKTQINIRRTPSLRGMALVENIPESWLLEQAKLSRGRYYEGQASLIWNPSKQAYDLGKFGWKAEVASLKTQIAKALNSDMGLTTNIFPKENCAIKQVNCLEQAIEEELDVPIHRLRAMTLFIKSIRPPQPAIASQDGEDLFHKAACSTCHIAKSWEHAGARYRPYSDFLLHDMGEGLADGQRPHRKADNLWRTAPLWGIRGAAGLLHDGRARNVEEAILWHGGQGTYSRDYFLSLSKQQRHTLIKFVEQL